MGHNHLDHHDLHPENKDIFLKVEAIHCANCVNKVSKILNDSKLCESYWIDAVAKVVRLRKGHDGLNDKVFVQQIIKLLSDASYPATLIENSHDIHKNAWVQQLFYAGAGLLISIFTFPHMSRSLEVYEWIMLLILNVLFYLSIKDFLKGAWNSLKQKSLGIDALVSLGAGSAYILSTTLILAQIEGHLFWTEAFSILLLISLGHYIENYVLIKADKTLRSLMVLAPPKAYKVISENKTEEVLVSDLKLGDQIVLRPGDRVAVDGKIIEGRSDFDESLLTGESMPASKGIGEDIFSGTINLSGNIRFEVSKLGKDTLLSQIIETVMRVRQSRSEIQGLADRISNLFVPLVATIALVCFASWMLLPEFMSTLSQAMGHNFGIHHATQGLFWQAFSASLGVLVISCPCAMSLATPAALMAVSGLAARKGILIRDSRAIESAEKITHVFFDKTGTLSTATPQKISEWTGPDYQEKYVYPIALQSHHPMSKALVYMSTPSSLKAQIEEFPGEGIKGIIHDDRSDIEIVMGNGILMQRMNVRIPQQAQEFILAQAHEGRSLVYFSQQGFLTAIFSFEDQIREGASTILSQFAKHAKVYVLSGDNKKVLQSLSQKMNLLSDRCLGELSPIDKVNVLQSFQKDTQKVAFVGDGLNDAPVLQAADLGIAVSSASDLAKQSADIVLITKDITAILEAFELAKKGMRTIRQNLFWAFAYNVVAIPLAFMGLISPVLCTISMAFSDLVIIGNSVRVFSSKKSQ
jgi:Cu+-exporting ATPase